MCNFQSAWTDYIKDLRVDGTFTLFKGSWDTEVNRGKTYGHGHNFELMNE